VTKRLIDGEFIRFGREKLTLYRLMYKANGLSLNIVKKRVMGKANRRTWGIVFTHVLLWILLGFILLFYPPLSWGIKLPTAFWIKHSSLILLFVIIFYSNYLVFVPKLLFKNNRSFFILWLLLALFLGQCLTFLLDKWLNFQEVMANARQRPLRHEELVDGFTLMFSLLVLGISTTVAAVRQWQLEARLKDELQKQQIASELSFLKAQINPHFFFNTLNNIYALSFSDVERSREALHKLSRMMRYLLYETAQNEASLLQELKFLKDHIELMKLRLQANNQVVYTETTLSQDYKIAPMLLLPFVENAFKHGISATKPSEIRIDVSVKNQTLHLMVSNTLQEKTTSLEGSGIGLQNTKRRLKLLYPERYRLSISKIANDTVYQVDLTLLLS